jgi:hypothetical protein
LCSRYALSGIGRRVAPFSPPQIRACEFPSTRLPAPRHVLWTSSRLDCSPPAPFAGPEGRILTCAGGSTTFAHFRPREPPPRQHPFGSGHAALSARLPVALRLAAFASWEILCPPERRSASRRLYWRRQARTGLLRSARPRRGRGGFVLYPGAEVSAAGEEEAPALVARHRRVSHFRRPFVTGLAMEPVRPSPGLPPPWWLAGGFGVPL